MGDSLKTLAQGAGGVAISFWDVIPEVLRLCILLATFSHIMIKIFKAIDEY